MTSKDYIGDGVYVDYDGFEILLSTPRGESEHRIYLNPDSLWALVRYVERVMGVDITIEPREKVSE